MGRPELRSGLMVGASQFVRDGCGHAESWDFVPLNVGRVCIRRVKTCLALAMMTIVLCKGVRGAVALIGAPAYLISLARMEK